MLVERSFDSNGVELNYAEGPDNGPPLLLVHGTGNRWQAFLRHIPELAQRWHIYAVDLRGHGGSGRAPEYGFGFYYDDIVRFIDNVIGEPTVIFGHSLGGRIALKVAAEHHELTKAIILGDSSLTAPSPSGRMGTMFRSRLELIEGKTTTHEIYTELKKRAKDAFDPATGLIGAKNLSMVDPEMLKSIADHIEDLDSPYNHFNGYNPDEHLPKVTCPVLILQAERGMLKDEDVEKALKILPMAYHVKLMDMPHEFLTRETEPVLKAVTAFLESLK